MATERTHIAASVPAEALREVQRQLIGIHYPLAEAVAVDINLQRRTLDRLMRLLEYVNTTLESTQPDSLTNAHS